MSSIKVLFKDKELRNKLLFSLFLLLVFRILSHIPVPWVDTSTLKEITETGILSLTNLFSGGALQSYTFMATGISAYISASIVIQLLTYISPKMHAMSKEAGGSKKIKKITIFFGIIAALISSFVTTIALEKTYGLLSNDSWYVYVVIAILQAIGTAIAIAIGETITEKGFGNGVSLLIFINIASSFPTQIQNIVFSLKNDITTPLAVFTCVLVMAITIAFVAFLETSEYRLKVLYSQTAIRGQSFGNSNQSFFPIKVDLSGVMPIIFASYILQALSIISYFIKNETINKVLKAFLTSGSPTYSIFMIVAIILFSYIYNWLSFDTNDISKNIQERGGTIPGIRPGKPTKVYIDKIKYDLTFISAIYLSILTIVPMFIFNLLGITLIASTSLIIMVGVSLETVKALNVEMNLRKRKNF